MPPPPTVKDYWLFLAKTLITHTIKRWVSSSRLITKNLGKDVKQKLNCNIVKIKPLKELLKVAKEFCLEQKFLIVNENLNVKKFIFNSKFNSKGNIFNCKTKPV